MYKFMFNFLNVMNNLKVDVPPFYSKTGVKNGTNFRCNAHGYVFRIDKLTQEGKIGRKGYYRLRIAPDDRSLLDLEGKMCQEFQEIRGAIMNPSSISFFVKHPMKMADRFINSLDVINDYSE